MSKPLTMTEGREELIREVVGESVARAESGGTLYAAPLLAEVDSLRAALAAAEAFGREAQEDRDRIASAMLRQEGLLEAAEAKLADSERACAGFVKMAADEMYRADAMAHALDQSPYMRARVKAQYVAARRAAEVK